jgi:hypothetical protein
VVLNARFDDDVRVHHRHVDVIVGDEHLLNHKRLGLIRRVGDPHGRVNVDVELSHDVGQQVDLVRIGVGLARHLHRQRSATGSARAQHA